MMLPHRSLFLALASNMLALTLVWIGSKVEQWFLCLAASTTVALGFKMLSLNI